MAIKVLKKTGNIELCHLLLRERLFYDNCQKYHVRLQYRSDQPESEAGYADVAWVQPYGFWMNISDPWHLNTFGLAKQAPATWGIQEVLCQFDFNPGKSGAFCRDQYGGILLLHNGDIQGEAGESLKTAFWQHYQGLQLEGAEQQDQPYAVVAHLGSVDIAKQVKNFLEEVARIRAVPGLLTA
jgi:hypothetical protein